jgi:hypothetical protein
LLKAVSLSIGWITTPGIAGLVMTDKSVHLQVRSDEAIQLDRHGELRAPRDDKQICVAIE